MKSKLLFLLLVILLSCNSFAAIRYVSKTGSSTPPYLNWETASDSIQKCIDICSYGDTVYVANGTYYEKIVMIPGLALIGAGADSCIIDGQYFADPQLVLMNDYCLLKNFKILAQSYYYNNNSTGVVLWNCPNAICEYNEVRNGGLAGVRCHNTNSTVRYNRIMNSDLCIWVDFGEPIIDSNFIYINVNFGDGIYSDLSSYSTIRGNTLVGNSSNPSTSDAIGSSSLCRGGLIENNLIYVYSLQNGIICYSDEHIINNTVVGNYKWGIYTGNHPVIRNNSVSGGLKGVEIDGAPRPVYQYNNVWNNSIRNYYNLTPDSTNISADPMYVNEDSLDFHLQKYSPLIDRGDPEILDRDGSRSDIGVYGGPLGESYSYQDLAPKTPVGLSARVDSSGITVKWRKNTESDIKRYKVFRDTVAGFTADSTTLVSEQEDTLYSHIISPGVTTYYYKIAAVDFEGNQSGISEELPVLTSSVEELQQLTEYSLLQNYPNPFNPRTTIGYRLKNRGYVKLYIYDIKGERLSVPVNQMQEAGYYEIDFSGEGLASGIYLYQIMVKDDNNIPVYTEIKKMLLIK